MAFVSKWALLFILIFHTVCLIHSSLLCSFLYSIFIHSSLTSFPFSTIYYYLLPVCSPPFIPFSPSIPIISHRLVSSMRENSSRHEIEPPHWLSNVAIFLRNLYDTHIPFLCSHKPNICIESFCSLTFGCIVAHERQLHFLWFKRKHTILLGLHFHKLFMAKNCKFKVNNFWFSTTYWSIIGNKQLKAWLAQLTDQLCIFYYIIHS